VTIDGHYWKENCVKRMLRRLGLFHLPLQPVVYVAYSTDLHPGFVCISLKHDVIAHLVPNGKR